MIDEKKLRSFNLDSLRKQIGYVPQDVFLFSDSITNNIGFGLETERINEDAVKKAALNASVYYDIEQLPEKFETVVGERGVTLSGGQKQRISIARALIKNPKVMIFDDCLSAVDAQTEQNILRYLNEVLSGKTAIIITHRIFSLLTFDKIIVIDEGMIAEEGTHESLMQKRGLYFELHELQQAEEKSGVSLPENGI